MLLSLYKVSIIEERESCDFRPLWGRPLDIEVGSSANSDRNSGFLKAKKFIFSLISNNINWLISFSVSFFNFSSKKHLCDLMFSWFSTFVLIWGGSDRRVSWGRIGVNALEILIFYCTCYNLTVLLTVKFSSLVVY